MSMEDVIVECKLFYVSGSETTPNLIVWTLVCLSLDQKWQTKARQEAIPTCSHCYKSNQQGVKETKLGDMMRPSAKEIIIPIMNIHHDRELWREDATEFKHQWFSEGVANAIKDKG
uniref:Uncharacterized protein n=1 Tax=Tanacetum cinerariifolium TaxID=118510 RepID=A0A699JAU1_TANCI|nr:hypothetical protein [Tanacetum cinerariifolium]